ncbi:MAG: DUF3581 domain-containing protein [Gammaproteobacteria bacterium SHHR-1]|uniref:DUF3581 domain-containing protein n=1 Tax=Magnetovirga frankeli TaxID=947516 RepID=UPI001293C8D9|nr:DUF3581 domain-containing protein [gamma proteobacterium SS-5]
MFLEPFYHEAADGVRISPDQASRFAKEVAGDFNPIHDPDAKRFCVPGDLLFALVLQRYGLSQGMCFTFSGMVGGDTVLHFPAHAEPRFAVTDTRERICLRVEREGESSRDADLVRAMACSYVAFSGQNFPHVLVPLLREQGVMINPERPLVIYESMSVRLDHLDFSEPKLEHAEHRLEVKGKRGDVRLAFSIKADGVTVGQGFKKLLVSGLKPYDEAVTQGLMESYLRQKAAYAAPGVKNARAHGVRGVEQGGNGSA